MDVDSSIGKGPVRGLHTALRVPVVVVGTLLYGALVVAAVLRLWRHYELFGVLLQAFLLPPALLYGLKGSGLAPPSMPVPRRTGLWTAAAMGAFLIGSAALSSVITQGPESDEMAYLFQARILGAGKLVAAPPPGSPALPGDAPVALHFNHVIVSRRGWYAKYMLGWPLVLALPARFGWAWLVNPLLGVGILIFTTRIARSLGGEWSAFLAVVLVVLSPCFLARCVVLMTHATAGLLVVAACWAWIEGTRSRRLQYFALMYLLVGLAFHVRPLTALLTAATLTAGAVVALRRERGLLTRILAVGAGLGVLTVGSVLAYNRAFTGSPWLSPYAVWRGSRIPMEISASLPEILRNLSGIWRSSAQSTLLFSFPLIFLLAGIGFWKNRRNSPAVWLLLSLFVAIVLGHLVQTEPSGSSVGERYWFEAYFAVAVLAALGIGPVATALQSPRPALIAAGCALVAVQATMMVVGGRAQLQRSAASIAVSRLAARYRDCRCVVFLKSSPPVFYGYHLNLNGPGWQQANVFYAVDPGPDQRMTWARTLGRERWVVLGYDPLRRVARQEQ